MENGVRGAYAALESDRRVGSCHSCIKGGTVSPLGSVLVRDEVRLVSTPFLPLTAADKQTHSSSAPVRMRANLMLLAVVAACFSTVHAQHFQRLGTCPTLGCILPPDQQDFLPGQEFDIRFEVHAPVNGSEANGGEPDEDFNVTIAKGSNGTATSVAEFFDLEEPEGSYSPCLSSPGAACLGVSTKRSESHHESKFTQYMAPAYGIELQNYPLGVNGLVPQLRLCSNMLRIFMPGAVVLTNI